MAQTGALVGLSIILILIYIAIIGLWIYAFVLFVKLARRGIKALDIYINKNTSINTNINKESSDILMNQNINREI